MQASSSSSFITHFRKTLDKHRISPKRDKHHIIQKDFQPFYSEDLGQLRVQSALAFLKLKICKIYKQQQSIITSNNYLIYKLDYLDSYIRFVSSFNIYFFTMNPQSKRFDKSAFKMAFPNVFGSSQTQNYTTHKSRNLITDLLNLIYDTKNMLALKNVEQKVVALKSKLATDRFYFLYLYQYAAILLGDREEEQMDPNLYLVFPTKWSLGIMPNPDYKTRFYPQPTFNHQSLFLGTLENQDRPISDVLELIHEEFIQIQKLTILKEKNSRKNHHTPSWLSQAIKLALKNIYEPSNIQDNSTLVVQSKGGTLDVGIHTGITKPDTVYVTAWSLLDFFIQDKELVSALTFETKFQLFQDFRSNLSNANLKDMDLMHQCLLDLRADYFSLLIQSNRYINKPQIDKLICENISKMKTTAINQNIPKKIILSTLHKSFKNTTHENPQSPWLRSDFIVQEEVYKFQARDSSLYSDRAMIFQNFEKSSKKTPDNDWITAFEDVIFSISIQQLLTLKPFNFISYECLSTSTKQDSPIFKCLQFYCSSMQTKNLQAEPISQIYSHIELMKILLSIIAFEVFKKNSQKKIYEKLRQFTIPNNYERFIKNFHSLSFKARIAAQEVYKYCELNKNKKLFFDVAHDSQGFLLYPKQVAKIDENVKKQVTKARGMLKGRVAQLKKKVEKKKAEFQRLVQERNNASHLECGCTTEIVKISKKKKEERTVMCQKHEKIQKVQHFRNSSYMPEIVAFMTEENPEIHLFFKALDPHLIGVIKLLMYSQSEFKKEKPKNKLKQNVLFLQQPLSIFETYEKAGHFNALKINPQDISDCIIYSNKEINFTWQNKMYSHPNFSGMSSTVTFPQKSLQQLLIHNPTFPPENAREHLLYANRNISVNYNIEELLGVGNIRVTALTQLPILLDKIKNRHIKPENISRTLEKNIVYHTLASMHVANVEELLEFKTQCGVREQFIGYIEDFLQRYEQKWSTADFMGLLTTGPIFSLLSSIISQPSKSINSHFLRDSEYQSQIPRCHPLISVIIEKVMQSYDIIEDDKKIEANQLKTSSLCSQQFEICLTGLSCFYEINLGQDDPACQKLLELLILLNHKQSYAEKKLQQTYRSFKFKAVSNSVQNMINYFQKNPIRLSSVVQRIYSMPKNVKWVNQSSVFRSILDKKNNTISVNLESGAVLLNRIPLKRPPPKITKHKSYQQIFSEGQVQVKLQDNKSYVTTNDFPALFAKQGLKASFSFNFIKETKSSIIKDGKEIQVISEGLHITMEGSKDTQLAAQSWVYVDPQHLKVSPLVPFLYLNNFTIWYSKKRECLIFRKLGLSEMNIIGACIFMKQLMSTEMIVVAQRQNKLGLDVICDRDSSKFDKIILTQNAKKENSAFQILKKIEKVDYIIQLETIDRDNKFWLHRFDLFCTLKNNGLYFDIFKDFRVSFEHPHYHKYVPWNCSSHPYLVLEKILSTENSLYSNNLKIIVPIEAEFNKKQENPCNAKLQYYFYEIHDIFHKVIGTTRQSQLYLAYMIFKDNNGLPLQINLTPAQLSISILENCLNNIPFNQREKHIMLKIKNLAQTQKSYSLILLCFAIFSICKPFKVNASFKDYANYCKSVYSQRVNNGILPFREQLSERVCKIIGINYQSMYSSHCKAINYKNMIDHPRIDLHQVQKQIQHSNKILGKLEQIKKTVLTTAFQGINQFQTVTKQCPIKLEQISDSPLALSIMEELQSSYAAYLAEQYVISRVIITQELRQDIETIQKELANCSTFLVTQIELLTRQLGNNMDYAVGYRPVFSPIDYIPVLLGDKSLQIFFPTINSEEKKVFLDKLAVYMRIQVQLFSCQRLLFYLSKKDEIDVVAILREIESPREQIQKRMYWVCFEVEMKIQIWSSQFKTFDHIFKEGRLASGSIPQLNMGEGKTQTIIPMIILELKYGDLNNRGIPRVNLLSSILEESIHNYYRFFSISSFGIPIISLPFCRQNQLDSGNQLRDIQRIFIYFGKDMILLIDQSSIHSLILKLRETALKNSGNFIIDKQKLIFKRVKCIDIFDEIDALMTPNKSFIYSVGPMKELDRLTLRSKVCFLALEVTCENIVELYEKEFVVFDETLEIVKLSLEAGQYPKGLRIVINTQNKLRKQQFKRFMIEKLLVKICDDEDLIALRKISEEVRPLIIEYILNENATSWQLQSEILPEGMKIIYMLRGLFAYGVYEHCLYLRCTVHYGCPNQERIEKTGRKVAVPYEASNIPSKRNDYSQPDVAILLSYLAYYNTGVNFADFKTGLLKFREITANNKQVQAEIFKKWYSTLNKKDRLYIRIKTPAEIEIDSLSQMNRLYRVFKFNRQFINYWLLNCVFPRGLSQYKASIVSSTWDHADTQSSLGFSGTKDMHRLFPSYFKFEESPDLRIHGTDGKMLDMLLQETLQIIEIQDGDKPLWKRFIQSVMQIQSKYSISSIIDVGALLAGTQLKEQIVPWLSSHENFNTKNTFKGISFCHENKWQVMQLNNLEFVKKGIIADEDTFIIFDEYRTRGADMKMGNDISGVISLGVNLTKDNLMQAAGRLRKIGRGQKLIFAMPQQIKNILKKDFRYLEEMSITDKVKCILSWVCMNTRSQTQKLLYENAKFAKIHFENKETEHGSLPKTHQQESDLKEMYEKPILYGTATNMIRQLFTDCQFNLENQEKIKEVVSQSEKYGTQTLIKKQNYDEAKEKQIDTELVQEKEQVKQKQETKDLAYIETDGVQPLKIEIPGHKFHFTKKLKYSKNFTTCTAYWYIQNDVRIDKKADFLPMCQFLYIVPDQLCMITIRQAYFLHTDSKVPFYPLGSQKYLLKSSSKKGYIARMSDLSVQDPILKENSLSEAFVQCKLFNGERYLNRKERNMLISLMIDEVDSQEDVKFFLKNRNLQTYYKGSSLEKLYQQLILMKEERARKLSLD